MAQRENAWTVKAEAGEVSVQARHTKQRPGTDPSREGIMPQRPGGQASSVCNRAFCCLGCPHTPAQSRLWEEQEESSGDEDAVLVPGMSRGDLSLRGLDGWK